MGIILNGVQTAVTEEDRDRLLIDFVRQSMGLTGTKYGCGIGQCGACTVHVDGKAVRSCLTPVSAVIGRVVTTIEGLADTWQGDSLHPVQQAFLDVQAPQCGFCSSGQIMNMAALFNQQRDADDQQVAQAMAGNLCRCGGYPRIRRAARQVRRILDER